MLICSCNAQFINAYGLFFDTWVVWGELLIVVAGGYCLGIIWGVAGIISALVAAKIFATIFWKPFLLFRYGFKKPLKYYFLNWLPGWILLFLVFVSDRLVKNYLPLQGNITWKIFILYSTIIMSLGGMLSTLWVFFLIPGGKLLRKRTLNFICNVRSFL